MVTIMLPALRRHRWLLLALVALLMLTVVAESWARPKAQQRKLTREEILERIFEEPDILINIESWELPSTGDLVLLGNRATPALVNCLVNNLDASAREICAHVLVATRDVRAIEPLIAALDDPSSSVQSWVIAALSSIEARTATSRLIKMVTDKDTRDSWIGNEAASALGRTGDPDAVQPLLTTFKQTWDSSLQLALWDLRRHLTPQEIEALIVEPLLQNPKYMDWTVIGYSIERAGELQYTSAVEALIKLYKDAGYDRRNRILHSLGRIGDPKAIPFIESLIDPTGEARLLNNVIFALERLGHDVVPVLRMAISDKRAYIRYNAAFVAGDIKESGVLTELIKALEDVNDIVRAEAAVALGHIRDSRTIPALEKASRDPHPTVQRVAITALLGKDYAAYRELALETIEATKDSELRDELLEALAGTHDPSIVARVMLALSPTDYRDRDIGVRFLDPFESVDDPGAIAFLVHLAVSSDDHDAFRLLARFADPRTAFLFDHLLAHPGSEVPQTLRALARLRSPNGKELAKKYFAKEGSMSQLYAAFYYAAIGDETGVEVLLRALEVAPLEYKRTVAIILTELDFRKHAGVTETLEGLLKHDDVYVRLYAARALAHWGMKPGTDLLRAEIDKRIPFIRDEVLSIVGRLPDEWRVSLLRDWQEDADPMLARDLAEMLESGGLPSLYSR